MANNACVHCGADCGKQPFRHHELQFCCNGCKQVYLLLNENQLNKYYTFYQNPGIKTEGEVYENKYAYLDREDVQQKMFDFFEPPIAKVTFFIPAMHCASCIWLLEHLHKLNKGIKQASVNFIKKEYTVTFNVNEISLRQLVELLVSIHYVPDLSAQKLEKTSEHKQDKTLLYKIGVAGFVFGNVMLYSLPEYFNGKPLGDNLGTFLYYLCYVLTVPLVFYSGSDYIVSAFKNLVKGIINIDLPIAIGILALFFVTSFDVLTGRGPGYSDSLAGFLFFLLIGRWYQTKTYQYLAFDRDYKSYFPVAVTRLNGSIEESALLEEVQVGDVLLIRNRELIPADSQLVSGSAMIDYSFVTGESTPVQKTQNEVLYAGGIQNSGSIQIKVIKPVSQSHLTQLWNQADKGVKAPNKLVSIIDKVSVRFTVAVLILATLGLIGWWVYDAFPKGLLVFTSVLIVACPCALALTLPFTYGGAMRVLGRKGLYLKNTGVIEKLTHITAIVFDKTGTITQPSHSRIVWRGTNLSDELKQAVVSLAAQSTHPLSTALAKYYGNLERQTVTGFVEMSGKGVFGTIGEYRIKLGSLEFTKTNESAVEVLQSAVHVNVNECYCGYFLMTNKYRSGILKSIKTLSRHYRVYLLSGDNDNERQNLSASFGVDDMRFNCSPQDKMDFIASLHQQGHKVLMTGDGLNDAGAFLQSDVSLSVADDIYHFSPAGDAIIEARKFGNIHSYIRYAKSTNRIIATSFAISLLYNLTGLAIALSGNLTPVVAAILMPISSVSVVAFTTFATHFLGRRL